MSNRQIIAEIPTHRYLHLAAFITIKHFLLIQHGELFLSRNPTQSSTSSHQPIEYQMQLQDACTPHRRKTQQHGQEGEHASAASKDSGSALPLPLLWLFQCALHPTESFAILFSVALGRRTRKTGLQSERVSRTEYANRLSQCYPLPSSCITRTSSQNLLRWKKYPQRGHPRLQTHELHSLHTDVSSAPPPYQGIGRSRTAQDPHFSPQVATNPSHKLIHLVLPYVQLSQAKNTLQRRPPPPPPPPPHVHQESSASTQTLRAPSIHTLPSTPSRIYISFACEMLRK